MVEPYNLGTRISHKVYGLGKVTNCKPKGKNYILEIDFDEGIARTILSSFIVPVVEAIEAEPIEEVEESSMEKLEKLIRRRNSGELTSEKFEEMKKKIIEEKPQFSKKSTEIELEESQTDKLVIEIQDSAISESNVVHSDDDRFTKLKDLTEMKEKGFIDDGEFKQMKKEILGK